MKCDCIAVMENTDDSITTMENCTHLSVWLRDWSVGKGWHAAESVPFSLQGCDTLAKMRDNLRQLASLLPEDEFEEAMAAWRDLEKAAGDVDESCCEYARNYPIGAVCKLEMHMPLGQAVYVARLRSATTVHPTVRQVAQRLADFLKREFNLDVGADMSEDAGPQAKRDSQTIRGDL